jgi:hypothetical protein
LRDHLDPAWPSCQTSLSKAPRASEGREEPSGPSFQLTSNMSNVKMSSISDAADNASRSSGAIELDEISVATTSRNRADNRYSHLDGNGAEYLEDDDFDGPSHELLQESSSSLNVGDKESSIPYTLDEERNVVRKLDRNLILFLALLYMLSFLDRSSE